MGLISCGLRFKGWANGWSEDCGTLGNLKACGGWGFRTNSSGMGRLGMLLNSNGCRPLLLILWVCEREGRDDP